ncbi:MAG: MalY/PatB family protein [Mycoplasmatales bacterium]
MQNFDKLINRKGTFCTQWDYTIDRFGNNEVLPFSISDMDFELPQSTKEILLKSVNHSIFGYTRWNHAEFREAISSWYLKRFDFILDKDYITYSPSVIYSLAELLRMESKNVLTFTPAYDAFFGVVKQNDCKLYTSELIIKDQKFIIDNDDFIEKLKFVDTLLLCSPHNPTGKVFSNTELENIVRLCKKYNVKIISDEIHMDITFSKTHIPILKIGEMMDYSNNCVIITSATKSFNFPGLLFSYTLIPDSALREKFQFNMKVKNGLSSCSTLGLLATIDVYTNCDEWLNELKNYVFANYSFAKEFILNNIPGSEIYEFDGTYLLWIDMRGYKDNYSELLEIMYNDTKVGIMDGSVYGVDHYLRINIGCPRSKLEEGLKRFKESVDIINKV